MNVDVEALIHKLEGLAACALDQSRQARAAKSGWAHGFHHGKDVAYSDVVEMLREMQQ